MAQYVVSIAIDDVITALGAFLQPFAGTSQIIRAQVNRVSPPTGAFVELTELMTVDLETPTATTILGGTASTIYGPKRIDVQVDFYGPSSGDQCNAVKSIYRSVYGATGWPDGIKPLYCSDGHQSPLITGEEQYESRWTLTASLQYNPTVSIPQQSANQLAVTSIQELP